MKGISFIFNSSPDSKALTLPVWVAAAARVAAEVLLGRPFEAVQVINLPNQNKSISVPVSSAAVLNGGNLSLGISNCDPGFSLDITRGLEIWTILEYQIEESSEMDPEEADSWLKILPGHGVGKVDSTKQICLSNFARELLVLNLKPYKKIGKILKLEIIFPAGKQLAERTSNSAFGVVDGLALIGMQAEAKASASPDQLINTIGCLKAKCKSHSFDGRLIFVIGENGLNLALKHHLNIESVIKTGNWLGPLLVAAAEANVKQLLLWGYHGKLIKLAGGIFHTHHHLADGRLEVLIALAVKEEIPLNLIKVLSKASSVESALLMMQEKNSLLAQKLWFRLAQEIEDRSVRYLQNYVASSMEIGVVLFDRQRKLRWAGRVGMKRINSLGVTLEA